MRQSLKLCLLIGGVALVAAPLITPLGARAEEGHAHYHRLPVMGSDWTAIRNLPDGPERIEREQHRQGEYFRRWQAIHQLVGPQHVSRKGQALLAARGYGKSRLTGAGAADKAFAGVDTLRVLLVRIGFEANRDSQLTTVDPSGEFVLTPPPDTGGIQVDPPPRNKAFYESHLTGLSEYYNYQSGGRLHIAGRVLPEGENDSYKLTDVADYGPGSEGFWSIESLERLVRDMMVKADQETAADGSANLAEYDDNDPFTYIIFVHAGSDWQSDINGDSPNDIPTFFVTLGEPQDLPSSGGSLSECSIIPETTNQDGYPGSIAAAFYHEFGHALGLVDIYNTASGLPQVGIWDLMDSGTNLPVTLGQEEDDGTISFVTAVGVLPPSLGVWNKWFLGWVETEEIEGGSQEYRLPAVQVPRDQYSLWDAGSGDFNLDYPQVIKAGASPREFFLLENRYVPFPDENSTYTPYGGFAFERDEETGVVLYLAGERFGSWTNSGMYDYFLPAGGLLAWHVNNDRIAENLETNTINAWGDGLRILEADGIQDVGVLDSYVLGWYGSYRDPFGEDNGFQNVYTDAFPSSRMYDRSWSGISLSDIRANGSRSSSVVVFTGAISPLAAGFPWETAPVDSALAASSGGSPGPRALDVVSGTPLAVADREFVVFADQAPASWTGDDFPASLFALNADGNARFAPPAGRPAGSFLALDSPLAGAPVSVPGHPSSEAAVAYATRRGTIGLSTFNPAEVPGGWAHDLVDSLVCGPLAVNSGGGLRIAAFAAPDSLLLLDGDGTVVGSGLSLTAEAGQTAQSWQGTPRSLARPGFETLLGFLDAGFVQVRVANGMAQYAGWTDYPTTSEGTLHSAVLQLDDRDVLWLFDDNGCLAGWNVTPEGGVTNGELLPITDPLVSEPAVADLDGDGRDDLILLTATHIYGFQASGVPLRGFPVRFFDLFPLDPDTRVTGPAVIVDATGDGVNELFFNTDGGHLVGLNATGRLIDDTPFLWGDTAGAGFAVGQPSSTTGKRHLYLMSQGGYTGEPMDRQFTNGRLVAYELLAAGAGDPVTSGWYGPAGGAMRAGSEGTAQDLGAVAPAAREKNQAYLYPNPASDGEVTVRFYSGGSGQARFELYNLEGEKVSSETFSVDGGQVVEHRFDCSMASSGVYLGRLVYPGSSGNEIRTMTLAVER
jgi:M6 family metalloprotease-like protein